MKLTVSEFFKLQEEGKILQSDAGYKYKITGSPFNNFKEWHPIKEIWIDYGEDYYNLICTRK